MEYFKQKEEGTTAQRYSSIQSRGDKNKTPIIRKIKTYE